MVGTDRQMERKKMVIANLINQILLSGGNKYKNGDAKTLLILLTVMTASSLNMQFKDYMN